METTLQWLDSQVEYSNFHLLFLLNLTKYLGFYPEMKEINTSYFDLIEGSFTNQNIFNGVSGENLVQFKKLLGINFDVLHQVDFSATNRQTILSILIQYFELHLSGFKKPKSLTVLKTPLNHFFDDVMIMADDEKVKSNRVALVGRARQLFLSVADVSVLSV